MWLGAPRGLRLALPAVALGIALLPGCGGSDSSDADVHQAPAAERTRFAAHADPICSDAVRQIQSLQATPTPAGGPNSNPLSAVTESIVRPGIPILSREAARLRAIEPRPDDSDLQRYLGLFDPILVLSEQRLSLAQHPDPARANELENDVEGLEQAQKAYAESFGFKECGTGFFAALTSNPNE